MSGIYYGLSIVAVLLVIRWFIQNDGRPPTFGLLAVKPVGPTEPKTGSH